MPRIALPIAAALLAALFLVPTARAQGSAPAAWDLDMNHSTVGFKVRHLGISEVRGRFTQFSATVQADATTGRLASVEATVQAGSVDTGIGARDDHLRGEDFFHASQFPTLTLRTTAVRFNGNRVEVDAQLTMRGVTKAVTLRGELIGLQRVDFGNGPQLRAGYSLQGQVNRREFGLSFNRMAEGVAVVSDQVTIELDIQIMRRVSE